ncbi:MAG: GNAT family N-acetyltransferase [Dysgonamonadaceae bacterium]|jgi:hypothetical protein|nr:GNAT family N-acetyltransferase [Dysgonamonadaceae bacterium]
MTNKEKYKALCTNDLSIPLYSQDWWLDGVCGENNWEALLYMNGEEIEAALPFYSPGKGVITMPAHTQTMGIWFNPAFEDTEYSKNLYRKQFICSHLISCLPPHTSFFQNFHYSFTDWLPFYWKGYQQTTRYNYILPDIRNLDKLKAGLSENVKRNIAKAQKKYHLEIKRNIASEEFLDVNSMTYKRQNMKSYYPEMLKKMINLSRLRNQGDIWGAYDAGGKLHAAVFLVWQHDTAYYIAGGADPDLRNSGAQAYVLWQAIGELAAHTSSFDLAGSMVQGVEHFFRELGAIQKPYFTISKGKMSLIKKIVMKIQQLIRK